MIVRKHTELYAWQFSRQLRRLVYAFLRTSPAARRDVDFYRQLRKSAASAPTNIAEGFGRFWPAEFAHKLRIAVGELKETKDHLEKAREESWLAEEPYCEMCHLADRAIGAAIRFAQYLDLHGDEWKKNYLARRKSANPENKSRTGSDCPPWRKTEHRTDPMKRKKNPEP